MGEAEVTWVVKKGSAMIKAGLGPKRKAPAKRKEPQRRLNRTGAQSLADTRVGEGECIQPGSTATIKLTLFGKANYKTVISGAWVTWEDASGSRPVNGAAEHG